MEEGDLHDQLKPFLYISLIVASLFFLLGICGTLNLTFMVLSGTKAQGMQNDFGLSLMTVPLICVMPIWYLGIAWMWHASKGKTWEQVTVMEKLIGFALVAPGVLYCLFAIVANLTVVICMVPFLAIFILVILLGGN